MKASLARSAAAGVLICMGCIVNLKVGGGIPGAILFSAGLWFVVNFNAELFTGRVTQDRYSVVWKLVMLLMNVIGAGVCGILASVFLPEIMESSAKITAAYADPLKVLWQSVMCGVCMYLATSWPPAAPASPDQSRLPFVIYGVALYAAIARDIAWWVIPLAAAGNALGSYVIKFLLVPDSVPWKKKAE